MSPGFCALPPGMFSVEGTTQITLTVGFNAAMARMAPSIAAPPAMSYFIFSMPSAGLMEMPPVSNVTALPTRPITGRVGLGVRRRVGHDDHARRLGAALRDAEQRAHFQIGNSLFVEDFHRKAGFFGHGFGFLARMRGVSMLEGSLTRSRVKFCDSRDDLARPQFPFRLRPFARRNNQQ